MSNLSHSPDAPVVVLADNLDVSDLVEWISAIPLTEWPKGSLVEMRPAMVTDPAWHGLAQRTDALVARLLDVMGPGLVDRNRWLSVVMPGHSIDPHSDAPEPYWIRRVHVPLTTNEHAIMLANSEAHHLVVGAAYLFDKTSYHAVVNKGDTPRIHFMFDVLAEPTL